MHLYHTKNTNLWMLLSKVWKEIMIMTCKGAVHDFYNLMVVLQTCLYHAQLCPKSLAAHRWMSSMLCVPVLIRYSFTWLKTSDTWDISTLVNTENSTLDNVQNYTCWGLFLGFQFSVSSIDSMDIFKSFVISVFCHGHNPGSKNLMANDVSFCCIIVFYPAVLRYEF